MSTNVRLLILMVALLGGIAAAQGHEPPEAPTHFFSSVAYSRDGRLLAARGDDIVIVWDTAKYRPIWRINVKIKDLSGKPIAFSPDGKTLAVGIGRSIRLWDAATGKERRRWWSCPTPVGAI